MRILIFNGSPRINGDTNLLIHEFIKYFKGQVNVVNTYDDRIKGCIDCRWCWKHDGCAIKDEMQNLYHEIEKCDYILIASPVYFSELTGPLLTVFSRLQCYYAKRMFRHEIAIEKQKEGAVFLCAGGDGSPQKALETAKCLLHQMNAKFHCAVIAEKTNKVPVSENLQALQAVRELAERWNRGLNKNEL